MAINATRHKRIGPGGSTRRLHQTQSPPWVVVGIERDHWEGT
jgi:hypothetical protein